LPAKATTMAAPKGGVRGGCRGPEQPTAAASPIYVCHGATAEEAKNQNENGTRAAGDRRSEIGDLPGERGDGRWPVHTLWFCLAITFNLLFTRAFLRLRTQKFTIFRNCCKLFFTPLLLLI